jgi:hypothetical protein
MSMLIPVATLSKSSFCGQSIAGIAGFEFCRGHEYLVVVGVVCCQVEVSAAS